MKLHFSELRFGISYLCMAVFSLTHVNAQDNLAVNYLNRAGDYADIYNGRMEAVYNSMLYDNVPYYTDPDYFDNSAFTDAAVVYRNIYYPNQKAHLDLYKEQLVILPPDKKFGVILNSQDVQRVYMYNKTFVRLTPPKESGLKEGYYIQLFDKDKMRLLCKVDFSLQLPQTTQQQVGLQRLANTFAKKTQYYLFYNNLYNKVKDKGSFSKLFPQYKKQFNKFSKTHSLNFKKDTDKSLTALAGYCDELLTSTNK